MTRASNESFKVLDETPCAYRPVLPLPPADLDTRRTDVWEPVRFLGEPIRHSASADRKLPRDCPHSLACAMEDLMLDVGPASGVRAAAPSANCADTPSPSTSGSGEEAARGAGGQGVLTALVLALVLCGCAPRPAVVSCRNTGTRFDVPGGVKCWVSVNYSTEHAAFQAFRDPATWVGVTTLPTGFCDVEWLP